MYSPCAPELGCREQSSKPVNFDNQLFKSLNNVKYPLTCSNGAKGWISLNSGHVTGTISVVAFNFIVQEPRGIIPLTSE